MKKPVLLLSALILFANANFAQRKIKQPEITRCYTHEKMMELRALDPDAYDNNQAKQEQILQQWISKQYNEKSQIVYTIPVVVQIFGSTANNAVTDLRVFEQIDVLTKDFRRTNSDTTNTPAAFKPVAADCEIEFCLATIDPQGNATTGIVRYPSWTGTTPSNSYLWNSSQYLNIFVYNLGGGLLGYTYLPSQSPNNAVHIGYQYFGKTGASAPYNKGRTATHEVGHWLNLNHIWGDANCGNDQVSDTPTQQNDTYGCPSFPNAAGCGSPNPPGRMFQNYMDYTNDACMNIFTAGQKARMIAAITQYRPSVFNNGKCGTTTTAPTAAFTASQTTIQPGACVNFTNQSSGAPTTYSWAFQGGNPATSSAQNPTNICFNDTGCHDITLIVSNSNGSDTLIKTCYIKVVEQQPSPGGCDTLSNFKDTDTPTLYGLQGGWGFVSGTNYYDDRAKADLFTGQAGDTVKGAIILFGKAYPGATNASVDVKVWDGTSGSPGSVLGSQSVLISQLSTTQPSLIMFSTPVVVSGDFFLGVEWKANGAPQDTVAIVTNTDGETNPGTAWELWNDGTWYAYNDINSWGAEMSHAIWVIKCSAGSNPCNLSATATSVNVSCNGGNDGSATVYVSGNSTPLTYFWNNFQTGATATGLSAGTYSVTVTDGNGCTATATATISQPPAISITISTTTALCGGSDGTATANVSGGTSPYAYLWSNGQTAETATGLSAGNYKVTVTDANGCNAIANLSIGNTGGPTLSTTANDCSANGVCDGSATVNASGGTPPLQYLWTSGDTTSSASGLCAGIYFVTVTDANGCSNSSSVTVSEPPLSTIIHNSSETGVNIFPNPNNGNFVVQITNHSGFTDNKIRIYNVLGEIVYQMKLTTGNEQLSTDFPQGIYFVEIFTGDKKTVKKISVIKQPLI